LLIHNYALYIAKSFFALQGLSKFSPQKPQMLRGYLIRLTREYTDGGMDNRPSYCGFCGKIILLLPV
jgi:hypothetical protein